MKRVHLTVLFTLLGFSSLVASWAVAEHVNAIELSDFLMRYFDLPWDPTRTGRKYLYFSAALFGVGGLWIPISLWIERRARLSRAPRIAASAALLCAVGLLTGIVAYEMRSPSWTTTMLNDIGSDDDAEALRGDPYVFFSEAQPDWALRIHSTEGVLSIFRALGRIGYSGANEAGDKMADEDKKRSSTGLWLMFISIGSIFGAVVISAVSVARTRSPG